MKTIPNAKELKELMNMDQLRDRIANAILEAHENKCTNCSIGLEEQLPYEISEELKEKGYKVTVNGVTNYLTLHIYW